ncbi:helix-turn-helix domain-containing protein [Clostridium perfringens]|uniref:helix-turn-helix domain-containing protein n=1 Tax=Clostridium perfringens TaxID=1502 RepID=UPI0039E8E098
MSISENIKFYRKKRGLTQQELADKIEKSINSVKKYESGYTNPPIDVINKIADALEINVIYLVEDNVRTEFVNQLENESNSNSILALIETNLKNIGKYDKILANELYKTLLDMFKAIEESLLTKHKVTKEIDDSNSIKININEGFIDTFAKAALKYYLENNWLTIENDTTKPNAIFINFKDKDIDNSTLNDSK